MMIMNAQRGAGRPTPTRAATLATCSVFDTHQLVADIEAKAVAFIKACIRENQASSNRHDLPGLFLQCQRGIRRLSKIILEGGQGELQRISTHLLLSPITTTANYVFKGPVKHWVNLLVYGCSCGDGQLEKDLQLDLARHPANLEKLRAAWPRGWRLICRLKIKEFRSHAAAMPQLACLIDAVSRDHAIILGMLRARMLAEYLRRLATEPMGKRLTDDDPLWPLQGAIFLNRLVKPARSIDKLLQLPVAPSKSANALRQAVSSGHLALDARLLPLARRIYERCGGAALDKAAARQIW